MLSRRRFLQQVGAGMAAGAFGWSLGVNPLWGGPASTGPDRAVRLALLADAHLGCGRQGQTLADNLLAAVAEINKVQPPVDLVFFLGDLADGADLRAQALGQEILATLAAPCWLLPGDHDPTAASPDLQGGLFSFTWQGIHFCGLDTRTGQSSQPGPCFRLRQPCLRWLAGEIQGLPPEKPLIILSHAPLYPLFRPWQWYTAGAEALPGLLRPRPRVLLLHGHVHQHIGMAMANLRFQGVRSTAWSLPDVHIGTTAAPPWSGRRQGRAGCGWLLLTVARGGNITMADQQWTGS